MAKKIVADFCKAVADPAAHAELMLFFLEQGNAFTLEYGGTNAGLYSVLVAMAGRAVGAIVSFRDESQEPLRQQLAEVVRSSSGFGWGDHVDLKVIYAGVFPDQV
jgi:hypothetical protein